MAEKPLLNKNLEELLDHTFDELFPICRSITGPGIERSMQIMQRHMPLEIEKVPTGEKVFDWTVPQEWHFWRATVTDENGSVVIDSDVLNLHVVNYSDPVDTVLSLEELENHLFSIPEKPDAVPYVTQYYKHGWGICLSENQRKSLAQGNYHVKIDCCFTDGGVPFASCVLPGSSEQEIVLTSYLCHPSLANNELSGPLSLLAIYEIIKSWTNRKYTYRFVLNPETIGSLCFLSRYHKHLEDNMVGGLILTCTGGPNESLSYKLSRKSNSMLDQVIRYVSNIDSSSVTIREFSPTSGSDERQYCAPGFNLPMGQIVRTKYGDYEGYHNSLDTKDFMDIGQVLDSSIKISDYLQQAENAEFFKNLSPYGEPQLGPRGLYPNVNSSSNRGYSSDGRSDGRERLNQMLYLLNLSDGSNSLFNIALRSGASEEDLREVAEQLLDANLLEKLD